MGSYKGFAYTGGDGDGGGEETNLPIMYPADTPILTRKNCLMFNMVVLF
jgi:hypothetical protein